MLQGCYARQRFSGSRSIRRIRGRG
jgi:hypothetical protein